MGRKGERGGETRKCEVCGMDFYVPPSAVARGYGKYCSRKCKGKSERVGRKRCLTCGKEMEHTEGAAKGKFCSYECFGRSIRTRVSVACAFCGKEFERKRSDADGEVFCSKGCRDSFQRRGKVEYRCKMCGKGFWVRGRNRKNVSYCSMACRNADPEFLEMLARQNEGQQHRKGLNKLELAGKAILEGMGLKFEEQVLLFGKFTVDVFLRDKGIVIQWDGDYWHGNPKMFRELNAVQRKSVGVDKRGDAYLRKCGMRVLRFWESDVKQRPERVADEVGEALTVGTS